MYTTTPVIDFERFRNGTPLLREQIAAEVDAALRTTGFFFLRNHGIAMGGVEACFQKVSHYPRDYTLTDGKTAEQRVFQPSDTREGEAST